MGMIALLALSIWASQNPTPGFWRRVSSAVRSALSLRCFEPFFLAPPRASGSNGVSWQPSNLADYRSPRRRDPENGGENGTRWERRVRIAPWEARNYDLTKIEACALRGRLLFSAALAPPSDEPSDHEHGPHESDDHAYADEQIGENDSGAALDAHGPSVARVASSVHRLRSLEDETSFREPLGALKKR